MLYGAKNMKKVYIPISLPALSIISGASAVASLALRLICLFFFYDKNLGYYQSGAPLPIIANILFALSIIFFLFAAIFCIDKKQSILSAGKLSQYAALLPMGALVFHFTRIIKMALSIAKTFIENSKDGIFPFSAFNITDFITILSVLSIIPSAVFFFLIFFNKKKAATASVYIGLSVIMYIFLCWLKSYFDFNIPINSTDKIFFYISCAGAVLFIFNEICAIYGVARAKFYYFSLFTAIISLLVSSISAVIGFASGIFRAYITLEADIFFIALLIYAIARLIDAQKSKIIAEPITEKFEEIKEIKDPEENETEENISDDGE